MPVDFVDVDGGQVLIAETHLGVAACYIPSPSFWLGSLVQAVISGAAGAVVGKDPRIDAIAQLLKRLETKVDGLTKTVITQGTSEMAMLDALINEVHQTTDVEQAAATAIQGIEDQLKNAPTQDAVDALTAELAAKRAVLAAAIANTDPAAPLPVGGDTGATGGATGDTGSTGATGDTGAAVGQTGPGSEV